jgi:hypothetical protein
MQILDCLYDTGTQMAVSRMSHLLICEAGFVGFWAPPFSAEFALHLFESTN